MKLSNETDFVLLLNIVYANSLVDSRNFRAKNKYNKIKMIVAHRPIDQRRWALAALFIFSTVLPWTAVQQIYRTARTKHQKVNDD